MLYIVYYVLFSQLDTRPAPYYTLSIFDMHVYAYIYMLFFCIYPSQLKHCSDLISCLLVISCKCVVELQMCIFEYTHVYVYIYIHTPEI